MAVNDNWEASFTYNDPTLEVCQGESKQFVLVAVCTSVSLSFDSFVFTFVCFLCLSCHTAYMLYYCNTVG